MPLSEKQLAANRANAAKSRGPVISGGRRNSSRNALKHGMFAQTILLPGESRERFLKLLADLTTEFQATTPNELALVETMAFCRWRVLRRWTLQASQIAHERRQAGAIASEHPPTQSVIVSDTLNHPPKPARNPSAASKSVTTANITRCWPPPAPGMKNAVRTWYVPENKY
jgi:hypothetical protein